MASLNFPVNPTEGEIYPDPPVAGSNVYRYDAAYNTWRLLGIASGVSTGTYGDSVTCVEVTVTPTGVISNILNRPIPTASEGVLGLSSPGIGLMGTAGVYDLLPPFGNAIGGVKQGANVTIASNGAVSVATASTTVPGIVQLNNTLSSTSTTQALTAYQGKILQDQINSLIVEGLTFCGTYDAGISEMVYVTEAGFLRGFAIGENLPAPNPNLSGDFVIVSAPGVPTPPAPPLLTVAGDWILYDGYANEWIRVPVGSNIVASQVIFSPYGNLDSTNVQDAIEELEDQFNTLSVTIGYLDDISSEFTGTRTIFNLTVGGSPFTPVGANIVIFLGGVFQQLGTSYTVSGDQIIFTEAPFVGSSFAGIYGAPASQSGGGGGGGGGTVTSVGTGTGLTGGPITVTGTISLVPATDDTIGGVKPDNSTVFVSADGTISAPGGGGGSVGTLQQVTDAGATTDNLITVNLGTGIITTIGDSVRVRTGTPTTTSQVTIDEDSVRLYGSSGGIQTYTTPSSPTPTVNITSGAGNATFAGQLRASGLTYPTTDGTSGQVLTTDGAGNLSWASSSGAINTLQQVTTAGNTTTDSIRLFDSGTSNEAITLDPLNGVISILPQGVGDPGLYLSPNGATIGNSVGSFSSAGLFPCELKFNGSAGASLSTYDASYPIQLWAGGTNLVGSPQVSVTGTTTNISNQLIASGLRYPATDGTSGQVLSTDGTGDLSWVTTATVVAAPASSATAGTQGQIAFGTGFFYWHDGTQWLRVAGTTF